MRLSRAKVNIQNIGSCCADTSHATSNTLSSNNLCGRRKKKQTLKITIVETDDDDDAVVAVHVDVIFVDMKGS